MPKVSECSYFTKANKYKYKYKNRRKCKRNVHHHPTTARRSVTVFVKRIIASDYIITKKDCPIDAL
jgi:hypothetical protein